MQNEKSKGTYYGDAWTWNPNESLNQRNLEYFLEKLSDDLELQSKIKAVTSREEVVEIAKGLGYSFTTETLASRTNTLKVVNEDDLSSYTWARWGEDGAQRWALLKWTKL